MSYQLEKYTLCKHRTTDSKNNIHRNYINIFILDKIFITDAESKATIRDGKKVLIRRTVLYI